MICSSCHRAVLVTWAVDGTGHRLCDGCIRRTLREADRRVLDDQSRSALARWRRLGFA